MRGHHEADTVAEREPLPIGGMTVPSTFSARVRIDFGARTDIGKVRQNNEDAYQIVRASRLREVLDTSLREGLVPRRYEEVGYAMVVADGMGGHAAGEVASTMALTLGSYLALHDSKWNLRINEAEARELMEKVTRRFQTIDAALTEQARQDPELHGMGTTLTAAYSIGADLFTFHAGDSRVYLYRDGKLRQLTTDHTLAQALANAGQIPPEEVHTNRLRHVLTNALGGRGGHVQVEMQQHRLHDGDSLLLCSDGLSEMVPDAEIASVLRQQMPSADAARTLVDLALEYGGKDNVTVLLARYTFPPGETPP